MVSFLFMSQKYLEVEDARDEEIKELESKTESLESIVRMFELKAKNAHDHSKPMCFILFDEPVILHVRFQFKKTGKFGNIRVWFTVNRLDEKEAEMRKEYNKLHERYTEVSVDHIPDTLIYMLKL